MLIFKHFRSNCLEKAPEEMTAPSVALLLGLTTLFNVVSALNSPCKNFILIISSKSVQYRRVTKISHLSFVLWKLFLFNFNAIRCYFFFLIQKIVNISDFPQRYRKYSRHFLQTKIFCFEKNENREASNEIEFHYQKLISGMRKNWNSSQKKRFWIFKSQVWEKDLQNKDIHLLAIIKC